MPSYELTVQDKREFTAWWNENHCEGDDGIYDEKFWAKEAFTYGIQYARNLVTLDQSEQDSYEERITQMADEIQLQKDINSTLTSVSPDLVSTLDDRIAGLEQQVSAYKKTIHTLALVIAGD